MLQYSEEKKILFWNKNCLPIEIKVKYSVAATLANRAVMTDCIQLFMVRSTDYYPKQQQKESNTDAAPEERKLSSVRVSNPPSVLLSVAGRSSYCLREGFVTALLTKQEYEGGSHWYCESGKLCKDKARVQITSSPDIMPITK